MALPGRKRRDEDAECLVVATRVPVPFHGSASVERFPRTLQNSGYGICIKQQIAKCMLQFLAAS